MSNRLVEHIANGASFTDDEWNPIEAMYDQCLLCVNHLVRTIVEGAQRKLDEPIIVFALDHGELLGTRLACTQPRGQHSGVEHHSGRLRRRRSGWQQRGSSTPT
jgi:hypothetical protein